MTRSLEFITTATGGVK